MITVVSLILILGLLVFVHELGHFVAAKLIGVEVKTFAFGFPPRLWSKKMGETTYAINALPLGGYVSLRGEDESGDTEKELTNPRSLLSKSPGQLLFVFISGVVMNVILAFVLFYFTFIIGFQPIYTGMWQHKGVKNDLQVVITDVEKDTPAQKEGILPGDVIKSVDGQDVYLNNEVLAIIREKNTKDGAEVKLGLLRDGKTIEKKLATYKAKVSNSSGKEAEVSRIGVILETKGKISGNVFSSIGAATGEVWHVLKLTFVGIVDLFRQLILKFSVSDGVTGPVGIFVVTGYFASLGIMYLVQFAALLSISLAVFNILPIPGLDGGHIAIVLAETVARRKFPSKVKNLIQLISFGLLILLMLAVTVKDVVNFDIISYIRRLF